MATLPAPPALRGMTKFEAKKRIEKLRELIDRYRYQYHVLDTIEVSDAVNDSLKHELYTLEQQYPDLITPDSPTQRVGGEALPKFGKVTHATPMLSMEDVFSRDEFAEWAERVEKLAEKKIGYVAMVKVDGLAISLVYEDGRLKTAATRGDGRVGEDVTQNIRTIEAVPLVLRNTSPSPSSGRRGNPLPERIEVRGEVYMTKKDFEAMNRARQKAGEPLFANPRNVSAGSVRQLDPAITAGRPLRFFAWRMETDGVVRTQAEGLAMLREIGFAVPPHEVVNTVAEAAKYFTAIEKKREKLAYWIDGVVFRVNDRSTYEALGVVGKTPRGLVAWKFAPEEATTRVRSVDWYVGRTGSLTPVATVDPTFIAGTTVTHATLHNADEIARLGLRIGDTVVLTKAGDIIPKISKVLPELREGGEQKITLPKNCPDCGSPIERREDEVALFCTNKNCYAQNRENILHAARAFAIDGLGEKIIDKLLKAKLLSTAPDIFRLKVEEMQELDGFGEILAQKLVREIAAHKHIALADFIVALGIRHVGTETAFSLAQAFGSLKAFAQADRAALLEVPDIGEVVADSIVEFLGSAHGQKLLHEFDAVGVEVTSAPRVGRKLAGKTFVLTGTLSVDREVVKQKIRLLGGSVAGSVSKKTDYLVVGDAPGSKLADAQRLGVRVLDESGFNKLLEM